MKSTGQITPMIHGSKKTFSLLLIHENRNDTKHDVFNMSTQACKTRNKMVLPNTE